MEFLDRTLVSEMERTKARGLNVNNTKFKVIIELKESEKLRNAVVESSEKSVEELERVLTNERSSVIERLNQFKGAENIKVMPFANAIYAELTPEQIHEISQYKDDLKTIRLSKREHVTC